MWICSIVLVLIFIGLLMPVIQERQLWIACAHGGTFLFFGSWLLNLGLGRPGIIADISWLKVIGFILLVPSVILFALSAFAVLKGKLVKTGIMGIVRHPMYLGTAIAALAIVLIFQSILSIILSVPAIILLWMASRLEDDYNIEHFGADYRNHISRVPRWNIFRRPARKR